MSRRKRENESDFQRERERENAKKCKTVGIKDYTVLYTVISLIRIQAVAKLSRVLIVFKYTG